jgi:hypothetical protein
MKAYGGVNIWIRVYMISPLVGGELSPSSPCRFNLIEEASGTHSIGVCLDLRAGIDDMNIKFFTPGGLELRPHGRPVCDQSPTTLPLLTYIFTCTNLLV